MNIFGKIKNKINEKRLEKEYITEIEEDFLFNKYKIIKINDLINEYKRGENAYSILKKISDLL